MDVRVQSAVVRGTNVRLPKMRLRGFACAAATALCMVFSASSQAAAFQVNFDPINDLFGEATFTLQPIGPVIGRAGGGLQCAFGML